uniref:Uncharacterized protein n=1 Tax=Aegilops tauschii subsp. strangulata TaxID=200361 RepID=A0A453FF64_AEGTS
MEYLEVYCRKVDDANQTRVKQQQSVATKEAEVDMLVATLGEHKLYLKDAFVNFSALAHKDKSYVSLKEQVAAVVPVLDDLKCKRQKKGSSITIFNHRLRRYAL